MAITDKKISETYANRDVASLGDRPNEDGLTASQLKARFDQLPKEVIPQYNALIDELNDTVLPGKSDVGHTHDDRYFTETEVGVLLSGKSDTTHNHDLTYAPIVHNHDDIYYTDDEVDTLLLSKSDTTHTHNLIKNATEANAKIEASSTGGKFTRDVADSNHAFVVDLVNAGSTGNIQQWRWQSATKAFMDRNGQLGTPRVNNPTLADYSKMEFLDTGAVITRNVNDANVALTVNQKLGTGNIAEFQFNGTTKLAIDKNGLLPATNVTNTPSGNISATTVQGAINELDTEKADKLYATNLVTNGDFSNGTTGWTASGGTDSVAFNTLSNTANGSFAYSISYNTTTVSVIANHKYLVRAKVKVTNSACSKIVVRLRSVSAALGDFEITTPVSNQQYAVNGIQIATTQTGVLSIQIWHYYADAATANGKVMEVQYVSLIDLTAIFGAGKEQSAIQMDNMLSTFTNSWFNGTAELVSIANLAQLKADKTQEAWITPTLLNSYVIDLPIGYRKDSLGRVQLRGMFKSGTAGAAAFVLPVGYRPESTKYFVIPSGASSGSGVSKVIVFANGEVWVSVSAAYACIDGVSFQIA